MTHLIKMKLEKLERRNYGENTMYPPNVGILKPACSTPSGLGLAPIIADEGTQALRGRICAGNCRCP